MRILNSAILIKSDDWEGLYVNGKLIDEGHNLEEGEERAIYFAELARDNKFDLIKMKVIYLDDCDIEEVEKNGNFPENIDDFISNYLEE